MRQFISLVLAATMMVFPVGCSDISVSGSLTIGNITISGSLTIKHHKAVQQDAIVEANNGANSNNTVLVDVPPGFTYDPNTPPTAVVTITTDTGLTFSQSFALAQADASSFSPATSGTQTLAFVAQNPAAVASFVQSATSQASSTVNIDIQSTVGFQGPTDGGTYTIYGRDYNSLEGVQSDGSAAYTAPTSSGGTRCPGGRCPNQC